jgi:hypothetical protein
VPLLSPWIRLMSSSNTRLAAARGLSPRER